MINANSDFDELIREYIMRFTELAGNSRVLVQDFYKRVDKQITKRFEFENKILRKLDKYRYKAVKQEIRQQYGWWARLWRWLRGKRKRARTNDTDPTAEATTNDTEKVDNSALLEKVSSLTTQLNAIPQSQQPELLEQQNPQYIDYVQPYPQYDNQQIAVNNVSPLLDNGDTKA